MQGPSLQGSLQRALRACHLEPGSMGGQRGVVWGSEVVWSFHYLKGRISAEQ